MKDERSIDGIIDISAKPLVPRLATAEGRVTLSKASVVAIRTSSVAKGMSSKPAPSLPSKP